MIPNAPSLARFDAVRHPARAFMADGTLRLVYAGALSPIYELDVVLAAIGRLAVTRPDLPVCLDLYGRDFAEVPLRDRAAALGVADRSTSTVGSRSKPSPAAIAAADIGLAPTRRSDFTDFSLSTKAFEYAAMGRTVVASSLPMVEQTLATTSSPTRRATRTISPRRSGGSSTNRRPASARRPCAGARAGPVVGRRVGSLSRAGRPAHRRSRTLLRTPA